MKNTATSKKQAHFNLNKALGGLFYMTFAETFKLLWKLFMVSMSKMLPWIIMLLPWIIIFGVVGLKVILVSK